MKFEKKRFDNSEVNTNTRACMSCFIFCEKKAMFIRVYFLKDK